MTDSAKVDYDVVVVGAGFAGLYALYRLRESGLNVRLFERGSGVGGTWFWNRYPGARCDIESVWYSYSFSEELQREWTWSARYAPQEEILAYLNHVADRFDLRRDIQLSTSVDSAVWSDDEQCWTFTLDSGATVTSKFAVMGTGFLVDAVFPNIPGIDSFAGQSVHTSQWPAEGVDFAGKRVGIVGTGSSSIQASPIIAKAAEHLYVFQRTPQYSIPAWNRPRTDEENQLIRDTYPELRAKAWETFGGVPLDMPGHDALTADPEEREKWLEYAWSRGGYAMVAAYPDTLTNEQTNELVGDFVKKRIRERINDPELAEKLTPQYPFAAKRLCVDTEYFEIFNRDNVTLVDLRESGISEVVPEGIRLEDGSIIPLDILVFATGYDAVTGPLLKINPVGSNGFTVRDKWSDGVDCYLGVMLAGFPNMFMVNGPASPSLVYNIPVAIEYHVDWIDSAIRYTKEHGYESLVPDFQAEREWSQHVAQVAEGTVYPKVNSWYMGSNVPGKPRVFLAYCGGGPAYFEVVKDIVDDGYRGFSFVSQAVEVS